MGSDMGDDDAPSNALAKAQLSAILFRNMDLSKSDAKNFVDAFFEIVASSLISVDGYPETRQSGGKGIAQNYGFAHHGGLERSPKGEFQDPHGVAAQFSGCGVVICV